MASLHCVYCTLFFSTYPTIDFEQEWHHASHEIKGSDVRWLDFLDGIGVVVDSLATGRNLANTHVFL